MKRSPWLVAVSALACAGPRAEQQQEVLSVGRAPRLQADDLVRCKPLVRVEGVGVGGWGTTRDMQEYWARNDAVAKGESYGATHVLVLSERDDQTRMTVEAQAYDCPVTATSPR